jgi:hypothetical protein
LGFVAAPLHKQIDTPVVDLPEPEPLVEPQRRIEPLDMNAQRLARGRGFRLVVPIPRLQYSGSSSMWGRADLVVLTTHVEPIGRLPTDEDDVEAARRCSWTKSRYASERAKASEPRERSGAGAPRVSV